MGQKYIDHKCERLVVLQTKLQAIHYDDNNRCPGDLVLPIGPEAMFEVEVRGWESCTLGDLWRVHEYEHSREDFEGRLASLISSLNNYSIERNRNLGIELGNYYAFQLWVIVGQVHHNQFIVTSLLKNLKPEKILCYTKLSGETFMQLRPDPDSLFADVLSKSEMFRSGNCEIVRIKERTKINTKREKILSKLPKPLRSFLRKVRDRNVLTNKNSTAHSLLVIGGGGDWVKLNDYEVFNEEFSLSLFPELNPRNSSPTQHSKIILGILNKSILAKDIVPYDLSQLADAMAADLSFFFEQLPFVRTQLKKYDGAVTSVLSFPVDSFLAHQARVLGLPVIVWQHGEKGQSPFDPINFYTELYYATDYFAYAPVVVEHYKKWVGKYSLEKVVAVGSIGKTVEWVGGDSILYATGKWFKTTMPVDPDRRLFQAHTTILNYLSNLNEKLPIIFKANNTPGLNDVPYEYENVGVEYEKPFTECLKTAKAVILDTPATTLVEACSTDVPIFVLGGRVEYTKEFLVDIRKRVVWCETLEELLLQLDAFITSGSYSANVKDRTYLTKYGCAESSAIVARTVRDEVLSSISKTEHEQRPLSYVTTSI